MFIRVDNGLSDRGSHGMGRCKSERVPVCLLNERRVIELIAEFSWEDLGPDCARNSIAKCASNVIASQKETGHHGKVCCILVKSVKDNKRRELTFMFGSCLNTGLGRVWE